MKLGYIRVSTTEQNLDLQRTELQKAGCDKIFEDKISGSLKKSERPGLKAAIDYARSGDSLIIWKLDRLGRSIADLVNIISELEQKNVNFITLTGYNIDTTNASGKLIFHIFAALAEFEKELIKERTNAGLKAARVRGRFGGRPKKISAEKIKIAKQLHTDKSLDISSILKTLQVSKATFYRMLGD